MKKCLPMFFPLEPFSSRIKFIFNGQRVTIPVPRGRKSLYNWKKKTIKKYNKMDFGFFIDQITRLHDSKSITFKFLVVFFSNVFYLPTIFSSTELFPTL